MPPSSTVDQETISSLTIHQEVEIHAPIEIAWEAVLDQMGPKGETPDGKPFPFTLEAWPGGRLYRDLGNSAGHLWGHVQVIKPPKLLEIWGPMMMSYPAVNHVQYRLTAEGATTRLQLTHRAMGIFEDGHRDGLSKGFEFWVQRMKRLAEARASKR
ncbi:MAG: Ligand-binding SRPBCC domain protein family [uncultured Phycisphaerae bacterium]|uniref:Ligand-binding SRPBCC domain protein family n=1 Tax=uncultured Phycisphaerae bacterium TaxID=904963 RepID=A0A6J4QD90_9BACT|nr:MAG: Ligand-binding SRPBCC domain protein family [uncultured Phycisphaerae bacterium]